MGKNCGIAVGINDYDNLQSLTCAQRDAEAMVGFFRQDLGCELIYHFAENIPPIQTDKGPLSSRPTFGTLMRFLRTRFEHPFLRAGDNLWFFFAGHGICHENRDYLIPLDADPGDVERTTIPISYVTERLRRCGADNVVLLVDACRSASRAGMGIGSETQKGVVTLFSCSPYERSYEIEQPPIQHGAFTYALLQGLQLQGEGSCATVERLYQYLRYHVPELNRRYQKPIQTPYAVVEPASKYHLILLPRQATVRDVESLKLEAFLAEQAKAYDLAEQLWIRIWAASPSDPDALAGVRRTDRTKPTPNQTPSSTPSLAEQPTAKPPSKPTATPSRSVKSKARSKTRSPSASPSPRQAPKLSVPFSLSRRQVLQWAWGAGIGVLLLGRAVQQISNRNDTTSSPTGTTTGDSTEETATDPEVTTLPNLEPEQFLEGSRVEFNVVTVDTQGTVAAVDRQQADYRQEDLGNDLNLELISLPGGEFMMGQTEAEKIELIRIVGEEGYQDFYTRELPRHSVTIQPFFIGKYPVTQAQWRAVAALPKVERDLADSPSHFKGESRPVEQVSWDDAMEFCARLSRQTNREYRLPTEAEWEYACRAGTTTPFHFGKTITSDIANYRGTSTYGNSPKGVYRAETTAVGSFQVTNSFGLYDMHGNVWEWCLDHFHDSYEGAPTDGSAWTIDDDEGYRMLRGGYWNLAPWHCRSAYRHWRWRSQRLNLIGFRVACTSAWVLT